MGSFVVSKFGGTSMGSASAMAASAEIVSADPRVRFVLVSATSGTTHQLLKIHELRRGGSVSECQQFAEEIEEKHREIAVELGCSEKAMETLKAFLLELKAPLICSDSNQSLDHLLSVGERMSSLLFTEALRKKSGSKITWIDARKFLITDDRFGKAEPDITLTRANCDPLRDRLDLVRDAAPEVFVSQGFIGASSQGATTTLGRGGSDYSAALFAEALSADGVEIWTDVPGILTMDPRVVLNARIIDEMSFAEAAEMANFGAKVLHPATLAPVMRANIPVWVKSTFRPDLPGTRISPQVESGAPLIRAIAVRKRQTLITVSSLRMLNAHGFLAKIFEVLARYHLSVDLVTTSEVSVALTIDEDAMGSAGKSVKESTEMLAELRSFAEVRLEEDLSLIAVIGNGLNSAPGVAAEIFHAIRSQNVRLICHGASEHNICFLVASEDALTIARQLHEVCIEKPRVDG
ncbi:MAG: lysine-sensitive aspartokinase 3 [Cryobacterium sp.]|nr:lysine-sensitive aspartokinase 3 [Oligoflexia bacterium]